MNLLKSHLSRKHHHAPEREGQLCPICGKKCYYTADLEIHIAVQHMGLALERPPKDEGEVMCHECRKVNIGCKFSLDFVQVYFSFKCLFEG